MLHTYTVSCNLRLPSTLTAFCGWSMWGSIGFMGTALFIKTSILLILLLFEVNPNSVSLHFPWKDPSSNDLRSWKRPMIPKWQGQGWSYDESTAAPLWTGGRIEKHCWREISIHGGSTRTPSGAPEGGGRGRGAVAPSMFKWCPQPKNDKVLKT